MALSPLHDPRPPAQRDRETRVSLDTKLAYAEELARADLLPESYRGKPGNVLLAVEYGAMLDVHPLVAIQHLHVINGRLGLSAELMRARVRAAGHRLRVLESSSTEATVAITTADDPGHTTTVTWTLDDARTAGLLDRWYERWIAGDGGRKRKDTWTLPEGLPSQPTAGELAKVDAPDWVLKAGPSSLKRQENWWKHPAAMLVARATTAAVRQACPEVLLGLELPDHPAVEYTGDPDIDDLTDEDFDFGAGADDPPAGSQPDPPAGATPDQLERIIELAGRLDDTQRATAGQWRETRGIDWQHPTAAQATEAIAYLEQLTAAGA